MAGAGSDALAPTATRGLVVVTGAAGFVGQALCAKLAADGRAHRGIVRAASAHALHGTPQVALGDLAAAPEAALAAALDGARAVVHLAGRAHLQGAAAADVEAYRAANVVATARLASAALRAGVERFVLASTIKVHGEASAPGRPLRATDPPAPRDAYARSKLDAERALAQACAGTPMAPIVLRTPLVYGPGVRGNFLRLLDAVAREARLPLGAIANRRDLLYVGNLVAAIVALVDAGEAAPGAWLVTDGEPVATPELVRRIARALDVEPRLLAVPVALLRLAGALAGRSGEIARLAGSLELDGAPLRQLVGPAPFTLDEGIAATARWWRLHHLI
jgi:nucleoside-diphosphate-sugar epimerase